MNIIEWIIDFLFSIWLLGCPLICLYWIFRPAEWFWLKHKYISWAIGITGFVSCCCIITSGVESFLWFIPENWTYEAEDGERRNVAIIIAFFTTIFIGLQSDRIRGMLRNTEELETEARFTQKRANKEAELVEIFLLDNLKKSELQEIATDLRRGLDELEQENKSNEDLQIERAALTKLRSAVEENIDNREELDST